jgi:2-polyprenyl-3-methyl-5-hydroxy-6-metoxy-1,4-benzoquinol methylase
MNKYHIQACPLCGGKHFKHIMNCTDHLVTGEQFELLECADCGFRFTQDAPDETEIGPYYKAPDYISHSDTRDGWMNRLYHLVRSYMLGRKARLVERALHAKGGRLLDYGAGTGYFAHTMYERGWDVEAIEKDADARLFALGHFDLKLLPEGELSSFEPGSFQVVTLWHVMEHVQSLDALWNRLHALLDDRGILVVAVPNCSSADAEHYGNRWAAYDVPRHLWHFTPGTMQQFGAKHGFVLEQQHPMPFDAFYIAMMSERQSGRKCPMMRGSLVGLKAWFQAWGHKGKSSSVIYIFRKKR